MNGGSRQSEVEPSAPASSAAPALEYAPTDRRRTRRRWVRRIVYAGVACVLVVSAWRWGPPAAQRAMVLYWQRQCLTHQPPAEPVVYETDPDVTPKLLRRGYGNVMRYPPNNTGDSLPAAAGYVAPCWRRFANEVAWTNAPTRQPEHATAFCHQLVSPGGNSRLVCVRFCDQPNRDEPEERTLWFEGAVIVPGDWKTRPAGTWMQLVGIGINHQHFHYQVLPGHPAADDRSRCVIHVHASQGNGFRLTVQLTDDDSLRLITGSEYWPPEGDGPPE